MWYLDDILNYTWVIKKTVFLHFGFLIYVWVLSPQVQTTSVYINESSNGIYCYCMMTFTSNSFLLGQQRGGSGSIWDNGNEIPEAQKLSLTAHVCLLVTRFVAGCQDACSNLKEYSFKGTIMKTGKNFSCKYGPTLRF